MRPTEKTANRDEEHDLLNLFADLEKRKKLKKLHHEKANKKQQQISKRGFAEDESGVWAWDKNTDLESFIMG